ncbi:MAG: hypothetical protein ACI9KS_002687 [Sulfitobacter sp.]|jgi:hypothetical protein
MKTILQLAILCALVGACSRSGAELGVPEDLGDFRLGHNVVVAENVTKGPFSRNAEPEELQAALVEQVDRRLGRYEGDKFYHLGISIDGYILALPGVPLVASPKSALIISVRVWDDAAGGKLTERPHQLTILESLSGGTLIGSGLTRTKEQQLQNLVENAALAIEKYLLNNREWFGEAPGPVPGAPELPAAAQERPSARPETAPA